MRKIKFIAKKRILSPFTKSEHILLPMVNLCKVGTHITNALLHVQNLNSFIRHKILHNFLIKQ